VDLSGLTGSLVGGWLALAVLAPVLGVLDEIVAPRRFEVDILQLAAHAHGHLLASAC